MPVVGFIDDAGVNVTFADLRTGGGTFALPRPFLRVLAQGYRSADHYGSADVVSVTTLANPVQAVRLLQRHDVYVQPLRSMWATFGTLGHLMLEQAIEHDESGFITERRLVIEFEGQLIGGTFDLLELAGGEWGGKDYKITAAYKVARMKQEGVARAALDYALQANVYRYMIGRPDVREVVPGPASTGNRGVRGHARWQPFEHAGLEVKSWELVCWSRDWTARDNEATIAPVEMIDVPLIAPERVENYLRQRVAVYKASAMCDDAGLPACTRNETWQGRRCARYCDAATVCPQLKGRRR